RGGVTPRCVWSASLDPDSCDWNPRRGRQRGYRPPRGCSRRSAERVALEQNSQRVTDTRVRSGSPLRARFANQLAEDSGIYRERVLVASMELAHQQTCLGWPGVHRSAADVVGSSHAFAAVRCAILAPAKEVV